MYSTEVAALLPGTEKHESAGSTQPLLQILELAA